MYTGDGRTRVDRFQASIKGAVTLVPKVKQASAHGLPPNFSEATPGELREGGRMPETSVGERTSASRRAMIFSISMLGSI